MNEGMEWLKKKVLYNKIPATKSGGKIKISKSPIQQQPLC